MLPVSRTPSFHPHIPAIQADPSSPYLANSLNTSPRRNPIYIAELREKIESHITDKKTKLAYWLAWAIPTLKSGEAFDSLAHRYFLAQSSKLFRESKQELDNQLRNFEIQEKQPLSEQEIAFVKQSRQACERDIAKIEKERQARYEAIMNGTSELRAFMLQQPTQFNTQNAEKFAHRYQQVAAFLRTTEEYGEALTGFKQFLESGAYTSNSNPTLGGVKQIQKELLEKWFRRISISAKIGLKEPSKSEGKFLSVKAFFLKDPKKPALRREHQTSIERVGRDLRRLAEEPKEKLSSILKDLTLARSTPKNTKKICLNHLVYGALIEYLPTIPQASAKSILERLAGYGLGGMPKVLESIVFEKLKLYPHSEISNWSFFYCGKKINFRDCIK